MPVVIPVKFRYSSTELWFDPNETGAVEADHLICHTRRGLEIGLATGDAQEMSHKKLRSYIGDNTLSSVERIATQADLDRAEELAARGDAALPTFRRLVDASGLDIKPIGVEWLFEGEKVICYFSAEERVDFRQLVRELGRELHERIDMRQIGVREEASVIGGYAHCGQELCCARFGHQFEPVSIRMAKEQDLPLNSTKISGVCGRLMCCLRYEFEAYRDFKSRAPKRNAVIDTPLGKAKIVEYDTPKEQVCLRLENGKLLRVPLKEMEASDAAREKADMLGCACRPDTVPRNALDRLQSPDVQMALAELDRSMGVIPEKEIVEDVPEASKKRRRKQAAAKPSTSEGRSAVKDVAPEQRRRRRRRRPSADATPTAEAPAQERDPSTQSAGESMPSARVKRRRHHSSAAQKGGEAKPPRQQSESKERRPRRRPGDHGGASAGNQPQQQRKSSSQQGSEGANPRRRRRGGRKSGSGGGASGRGNTAE